MTKPGNSHDAEVERVELGLLAADVHDAARALRVTPGLLSIVTLPIGGFVAEESLAYFDVRNRKRRMGSLDSPLLEECRHSLKKIRARLKLFDDSDTGPEQLVSFMATVRQTSRVLFAHPTSRVLQALSGPFRPDLSAFFSGDYLVGTSHTALPTMGVTPEMLANVRPGQFGDFNRYARGFGEALGAHLARLAQVLTAQGVRVVLAPPDAKNISITSSDFLARRFYRHAERAPPNVRAEFVAGLTLCAAQANACLYVFPRLLGTASNLLFRMQFLTAYHGSNALRKCVNPLPSWLPKGVGAGFEIGAVRNALAHYELRDAARFAVDTKEPLLAAVAGISDVPVEQLRVAVVERLERISAFLGTHLTKPTLGPLEALLGTHT